MSLLHSLSQRSLTPLSLNKIASLEDLRHVKRVQKKTLEGGKIQLSVLLCLASENDNQLDIVPKDVLELINSYQFANIPHHQKKIGKNNASYGQHHIIHRLRMWGSPFSRRVEIALKLKGVEYEYIEEKDFPNKSPLLLKSNPVHKKIPVLIHNGKPIAESVVILEYIDDTWKNNPILPQDPHERAMARFWAKFIDDKFLPSFRKAYWSSESEGMDEAFEQLKTLENELKGKKFFGGETIGLVDIVGCIIAYWVGVIQEAAGKEVLTKEKFPILCKWIDELVGCSAIKENLPPRDELRAFFKGSLEAAAAAK